MAHKNVFVKKGKRLSHGYATTKAKTISHGESKDVSVATGKRLIHGYETVKGDNPNKYYKSGGKINEVDYEDARSHIMGTFDDAKIESAFTEKDVIGLAKILHKLRANKNLDAIDIWESHDVSDYVNNLEASYLKKEGKDRNKNVFKSGGKADALKHKPSGKGRKLDAKYIPKRDVAEVIVTDNKGKEHDIDGANVLNGIYVKRGTKFEKGGNISEIGIGDHIIIGGSKNAIVTKIDKENKTIHYRGYALRRGITGKHHY